MLLLSFGGPEKPADVMPFLENVTRGRGVPRERLETVAQHYLAFGGRSPINDECRKLAAALERELAARGPRLPLYWGNRNWMPFVADTVAQMKADGVRRAVAVATSAYSSYSACRQYLEDIERARESCGPGAPVIEKLPPYWDDRGFLDTMAEHTRAALAALPRPLDASALRPPSIAARLVFTAHSLPVAMANGCEYARELREASAQVARAVDPSLAWDLVWQSRSGPPQVPWLEPDVLDHLRDLADHGVRRVVLVPIGFVADHMEVVYDLDVEARRLCDELGIAMTRAACVGAAPRFVAGLRDRIAAWVDGSGRDGERCGPGCCRYEPAGRPGNTKSDIA